MAKNYDIKMGGLGFENKAATEFGAEVVSIGAIQDCAKIGRFDSSNNRRWFN